MEFTPYALPAIAALLAKVGILFYARRSAVQNAQTRVYLLFLFCLAVQNLTEIQLFLTNAGSLSNPPQFAGTLYFSVSIAAIAFLLHLSLLIARGSDGDQDAHSPSFGNIAVAYVPALALQVLLWGTPLVVAGFEPMGYTFTKVPGPLYPLFQGFAIAYLFAAPALLYHGYRSQVTPFRRLQNKLFLLGLLPIPVLVASVIVLQQLGSRAINSTVTLPVAVTFFLVVTAYATHQYRLFEIEFFIPGSKVRKRKTAFYRRIQATIAAIAELRSAHQIMRLLADTLHCDVALVGGPRTVTATHVRGAAGGLAIADFPHSSIRDIAQITVAREINQRNPELHETMKRHRVGAVVPFTGKDAESMQWLVLGDHFSNNVYSPLDFKVAERLFSAIGERFLDDFLRVRVELKETEQRLQETRYKLGLAWHKEHQLKTELHALRDENEALRYSLAALRAEDPGSTVVESSFSATNCDGSTLDQYLSACESQAIVAAILRCRGHKREAARMLGVTLHTLERLMQQHDLEDGSGVTK